MVQVLLALAVASNGATNAAALRRSVPKQTVVGLFRDLRGITLATNSRRTYGAQGLSRLKGAQQPRRWSSALSVCPVPGSWAHGAELERGLAQRVRPVWLRGR